MVRSAAMPRLDGGALCLDFTNTVADRFDPASRDALATYDALVRWTDHAGGLDPGEANRLLAEATRRPDVALAAFHAAVALREALYRVFRAVAHVEIAPADDVRRLHDWYISALQHSRITPIDGRYAFVFVEPIPLDGVLYPIAASAVRLLLGETAGKVKQCARELACGWLFLDTTKNGTRRWCSMEACGSVVKADRLTSRRRAARAP